MDSKFTQIAWIALACAGAAAAATGIGDKPIGAAQERGANQGGPRTLKDPIELCEKLAGVERDICVRQAREKPGPVAPGSGGAMPGVGGPAPGGTPGGGNVAPPFKK